MNGVGQAELLDHGESVGGVGVHIVTFGGLARPAVATAIMGNDAVPPGEEEHHLAIPIVRAQRPAVVKEQWLCVLGTPVLVEDLGAVCGGDLCHRPSLSFDREDLLPSRN